MRVAIFGVGGVGGYFGARLAASGADVSFIARGAHLAAIKNAGLTVESPFGNLQLTSVKATDKPAEIGPVDAVLFSVKLYDVESAAAALKPLLKPDTAVIALQNGIDAETSLGRIIGAQHVVGGVAYISATIAAPGLIKHLNNLHKLAFGEMDGRASPRLEALKALCTKAGFDAEVSANINKALWEKFVFLVTVASATGVTRHPLGPLLADPDTHQLISDLAAEAALVGRAAGIDLPADVVERTLKVAGTLPAAMKASLAHDLDKGNRIEVEGLQGALIRLANKLSVPVPASRAVYAALKLFADGHASSPAT